MYEIDTEFQPTLVKTRYHERSGRRRHRRK